MRTRSLSLASDNSPTRYEAQDMDGYSQPRGLSGQLLTVHTHNDAARGRQEFTAHLFMRTSKYSNSR